MALEDPSYIGSGLRFVLFDPVETTLYFLYAIAYLVVSMPDS